MSITRLSPVIRNVSSELQDPDPEGWSDCHIVENSSSHGRTCNKTLAEPPWYRQSNRWIAEIHACWYWRSDNIWLRVRVRSLYLSDLWNIVLCFLKEKEVKWWLKYNRREPRRVYSALYSSCIISCRHCPVYYDPQLHSQFCWMRLETINKLVKGSSTPALKVRLGTGKRKWIHYMTDTNGAQRTPL